MRTLCILFLLCHATEGTWTPRDRFWKYIQDSQSGLFTEDKDREVDVFDDIQSCFTNALSEEVVSELLQPSNTPHVVDTVKNSLTNNTLLVEIGSAMSPHQAEAVKALSECARQFLPSYFEHRDFAIGGNDVTFLHVILQIFLPSVAETIQRTAELAYETANWKQHPMTSRSRSIDQDEDALLPPPGECGLRTTELLSYKGFKHLGEHGDGGSTYTVVFSFSDPKTFQGGEYFLHIHNNKQNEYFYLKPRQYSAIVFLSNESHGVTDIAGNGVREMFANELWVHDDPPFPQLRPQKEHMELFTKWVNEDEEDEFDPKDPGSFWPSDDDVEEYLRETGREGMKDGSYEGHQWYSENGKEKEEDEDDYWSEDDYYWDEEEEDDWGEDYDEDENEENLSTIRQRRESLLCCTGAIGM